MQMEKQSGRKSSYVRHGKSPYVYSPAYYAWRSAVLTGDKEKIRQADGHWQRQNIQLTKLVQI